MILIEILVFLMIIIAAILYGLILLGSARELIKAIKKKRKRRK